MSLIIQHNMPLLNAQNKYKVNTGNKAKSTEKLSSGYRINKAADDAAGLTISEKMRRQIRGLDKGTQNGQDGISWVQTGDGALNEVHDILHRMKELTVQSLNDTNTDEDRAALQAEMDALQSEIDRITDTTQFNTKNIFADHEPTYYQFEGNVQWNQSLRHIITAGDNDLVIQYTPDDTSGTKTVSITVPAGEYTTQELTDEIEDALIASGASEEGIVVEYTNDGTFNIGVEGGQKVEEITGELAYLLYDTYKGGSVGALIGTTSFPSDELPLTITDQNNDISFDIEYFDGTKDNVSISLTPGSYTRPQLIEVLNNALVGTRVEAKAYGTGIKLGSDEAIITGFKGDMFKIDGGVNPYTSIFYDNVKYGSIEMTSAVFKGGAVIPENPKDEEHKTFNIGTSNNVLTFTANDSNTPITITIPEDEYTVYQMRDKLNELFAASGLELNATVYDTTSSNSNGYYGIEIVSTVKGAVSKVGLDSTSSAYNTLFVTREYNSYHNDAVVNRDTKDNAQAYFKGSKTFDTDLTINDSNNEFKISLTHNGTVNEYVITLDNHTYSADGLRTEIDDKLNGSNALAGYKGLIDVTLDNGTIKLTATENSGITVLNVEAVTGDDGYDNIFVGKDTKVTYTSVSNTGTSTTKPSITLNTEMVNGTTKIDFSNSELVVNVNGVDKTVTLPTGDNITESQITSAINKQLEEKTLTTTNRFSDLTNVKGTTTYRNFSYDGMSGDTSVSYKIYHETGSADTNEGSLEVSNSKPAVVEMAVAVPSSMTIDNSNNALQITINDTTKAITLSNNTYSRSGIVSELQKKIDGVFGTGVGGAIVSLNSDNELVFTARMGQYTDGRKTNIGFDTGTSSFIAALHTNNSAGYVDTNAMLETINITAGSTFSFDYEENGVPKTANITFDSTQSYTRDSFVALLNQKFDEAGVNITAMKNGTKLRLITDAKGDNNSVSYSTYTGGTAVESIFGPMVIKEPATGTANCDIQEKIIIDSSTNQFNITVNGQSYNLTLTENANGYSRSEFVDELNKQFLVNNVPIKVELSGNRLKYTTTTEGSDSSFAITYDTGGSSMIAIYGQKSVTYPGVKAEFNSNGQLVLTGTQNGGSLSVNSNTGSVFQEPDVTVIDKSVYKGEGYYSNIYSSVNGVNIGTDVVIDQYNDDLQFKYYTNGTAKNVSVVLQQKTYSHNELAAELQSQIDSQVGADQLEVTVDDTGVTITAKNVGSKYYMLKKDFSGGFYDKVMCTCVENTMTCTPNNYNGSAARDTAFTVGRKDVKNNDVEIKAGINDTLSIDFTYIEKGTNAVTEKTLVMTLDTGVYKGTGLKNMIQEKLNDALAAEGYAENMIEVGIGNVSTGVVGANDATALNFKLSNSVRLPGNGTYIIDGVSGNAAFSVFYQTDGELIPAYVKGAKDISNGVSIVDGENELSFDVEGVNYAITLAAGDYTADEIIAEVNNQLTTAGAPVVAEMEDGVLKISHSKLGERKIENITGGAKQALFFNEKGEIGEEEKIHIQLSSEVGDYVTIDRPIVNTVSLGINSIAITRPKYANKALSRIDAAVEMLSTIRSDFGAKQNRLEHAMTSNKNASENTQAAESRLRDLDMADEMVKYSKDSILMQAGEAVMAHAMTDAEGILRLLQ